MPVRRALLCLLALALAGCPRTKAPRRPEPLPAAAVAHYLAGRLALLRGELPEAVKELRAAAAAAPGEAMIAVALIDAIYQSGDKKAARAEAMRAEATWPREPAVWLEAGAVLRGIGSHEDARLAFEHALRLDRTLEAAWLGLAASWTSLEQPAKAERTYRDLLKAVPGTVDGRFFLAMSLLERDDAAGAEPELRKVLELDPDQIDARLTLAHVLRAGGKLEEAVVETRQAFDRTGGDLEVADELFWLLCEADDRQAALDLLGLLDDPSQTLEARIGIANLYRQIGALDDAVRVADAVRADAPDLTAATLVAAQARADRATDDDRDAAIAMAIEIPAASDDAPAAVALAAEILVAQGELDRAAAIVAEAQTTRPDAIDLLAAQAEVLHARGDTAGGRAVLERAVAKREGSVALRYALAGYEDRTGNPAAAAAHAEVIVAARPDHVAALNLAGYALAKSGKHLDRAEVYLLHARELAPGDPALLDSWGWFLYRSKRLAEAEAAIAHAAHLAPNQAEILWHLGEVRAARGDRASARTALDSARAAHPDPELLARIEARLKAL